MPSLLTRGRWIVPKQSSYDVEHTSHGQTPTRPQPKGGQGHRWPMQSAQHRMHFSQPHHVGHGRPFPLLPATVQRGRILYATPRQTCPQPRPRAQIAFKDLMIHGILQFTLSIAFRYVLHRNESRDIRCRESFLLSVARKPKTTRQGVHEAQNNHPDAQGTREEHVDMRTIDV